MRLIKTEDAVGQVLCHDMTQIIKGVFKGPRFRKGHIVAPEDVPVLLSMGKENLYVWEVGPEDVHENDAAERLCALCLGPGAHRSEVKEGKISLTADREGLFWVDSARLRAVNAVEEITIATRHGNTAVRPGDPLCGLRVIPLVIREERLGQAEAAAGQTPLMGVKPYVLKEAGVVTTGSEILHGRIRDEFTPVIVDKLKGYGMEMTRHAVTGDDPERITAAIAELRQAGVDLILCTGGMSVDPDDNTPAAIRQSGAKIATYGAPVLPGAMFLLGYFDDGTPIVGLPGCVMYAAATVFDLALPRLAAGVKMTKEDFIAMGEGGLCLNCQPCTYPICPFGK